MRRLIKIAAVLLVALWLPATLHCRLEGLGFDALFACADQTGQTAHTDGADCTDDGCQSLEDGQFALAKTRIDAAAQPSLACVCVQCFRQVAPPSPTPEIFAPSADVTLRLQRTWQFTHRAALPARAPSLNC